MTTPIPPRTAPPPITPTVPPPHSGAIALDPDALARWAGAVPSPGPAADGLVAAARALAVTVRALLPGGPDRPAGGRSGPLADLLAEHWAGLGRAWTRDVEEHVALVDAAGIALTEVDRAPWTAGPPR